MAQWCQQNDHTNVSRVRIPVGAKDTTDFHTTNDVVGITYVWRQCHKPTMFYNAYLRVEPKAADVGKGEGLTLISDETSRTHDALV